MNRGLARTGWTLVAVWTVCSGAHAGRGRELAFRRVSLDLPAPPAALIPADLDGDGLLDLVAVVPYIAWGGVSFDRVEDAIQVTEVVPALFDRREVRAWRATPEGGYAEVAPPLDLPKDVLSLRAGNRAVPVVALTETGVDALRLAIDESGRGTLTLEEIVAEPSLVTGSGALLPDLEFVRDADGDGTPDLFLPVPEGIAIHRGTPAGFEAKAAFRGTFPRDVARPGGRDLPWPDIVDVDADGKPDLVTVCDDCDPPVVLVARGLGGCRFASSVGVRTGCLEQAKSAGTRRGRKGAEDGHGGGVPETPRIIFAGDLDGDGRGDVVTRQAVDTGRSEMKQTKRPHSVYRIYRMAPDLSVSPDPSQVLEIEGYASSGNLDDSADPDFKDIDGDGRKDLITLSLDFSVFQALRVLTTKKIGIGLEFRTWCNTPEGQIHAVDGQVLEEKLRLDLNQLEIGRLAQFRGDFDGDKTVDFLRLGKGNTIAIHRGHSGCRYSERPDLTIPLDAEIENVGLVRVADWDGDGASDVAITRLLPAPDEQVSNPVRIDLLLSGGHR